MDAHSLRLLEFDRVTAAIAELAAGEAARARLLEWRPIDERAPRALETECLAEAIRRHGEPGEWCRSAPGDPLARLDRDRPEGLDGPGLVELLGWLEAGRDTRAAWDNQEPRERHPRLAGIVDSIPPLARLRERLAASLEPDGRVADGASPALRDARRGLERGERQLEQRIERWARGFGETAYVTRHGERFVALVPAAGFPRRRGIVHDVSGSGQSLFVEPIEFCDDNNELLALRARAHDEERRVLRELAQETLAAADEVRRLHGALVTLDTLRARARWAHAVGGIAIAPGGGRFVLRAARHPLLAMGERREAVVPLDLELEGRHRLLLVSGPNMGGKTVLLKTVGLAAALAHAALPVPAAEGSAVPELDVVLADLGDEQSVDRGLSTFAAHLQALRAMTGAASPRALLLVDELGAGTDPEEGGSLGRALLERFAGAGAWGVVTTHLGSLKRVAQEVEGIVNGSLDFDVETLTPRYRFLPGVPGASHALAVAERLGLPADVLARARALTPGETHALERLLADVHARVEALEQERRALAAARDAAEAAAAAHRDATESGKRVIEDTRRRLTRESEVLLARARELWQQVQREARRAERSRAGAERLREELAATERAAERLQHDAAVAAGDVRAPSGPLELEAGRRVRVRDLGVEAEVVSGPDDEGRVLLRRGSWNIRSHVDRLEPAGGEAAARPHAAAVRVEAADEAPALEVDLRGLEADEALGTLDRGLDRAVVQGFSELRIIHGVGRGVLRAVVERHLRGHPQVTGQRLGGHGEGGRGVTVATLR